MTFIDAQPPANNLQALCELGQRQLMEMNYLVAEATLTAAEATAWAARDFDTLSRLYLPLQETRRQIRQRCGEGVVCLDLISEGPDDWVDAEHVIRNYSHGQLLVAGWGSIAPALNLRRLAKQHGLYLETFLAAVYRVGTSRAVVIVPTEDVLLPPSQPLFSIDALLEQCPPHCIVLHEDTLPHGSRKGTPETYGEVMAMWEQLHFPFLAAADMQIDPVQKIDGYRKAIQVDPACELAHQKLSTVAREVARQAKLKQTS